MIFDINFDKWIATMLPTFLRRRRIFAFCRVMCAPVVSLYSRFLIARSDHIYKLSHNGQVCYIRHALNDAFGLTKGFEIGDTVDNRGEWIYAKDPAMPQQFLAIDESKNSSLTGNGPPSEYPVPVLSDESRLNAPQNSFIVYVPLDIYTRQLDKVKAIVERYRILSKTPIYTPTTSNEQSPISLNSSFKRWQWPLSAIDARSEFYTGATRPLASNLPDRR